ncbi:MAG: response regulator [Anaerolineaceae bacterium]
MKILICDDQALIRDSLEMLLNLEKDIQVIACAEDGFEAVELTKSYQPDLVLMDLNMPGMNGILATHEIRKQFPNMKILVLTTFAEDEWVFDAIRAGASGYILKDSSREELLKAIRSTVDGQSFLDPAVAGKLMNHINNQQTKPRSQLIAKLTDREVDVLAQLAQGLNNNDIALKLNLTEGTVRNHISAILTKLGVTDRTQAAILAIQHGLDKA